MTERINTNVVDFVSGTFTPDGDFSVQASIPAASLARVDVEGRVDNDAEWVPLAGIDSGTNPPILRFAKVPQVRLHLRGNDSGADIKAWSGE